MTTPHSSAQDMTRALEGEMLAVTVEEAARLLSLNQTKMYALCMRGESRSIKIGRSQRIPVAALQQFIGVSE